MPQFDLPLEDLRRYRNPRPAPPGLIEFWDRTISAARAFDGSVTADYGRTLAVTLDSEPVCLYNLNGEIFATHDVCTHGSASLSEGFIVEP